MSILGEADSIPGINRHVPIINVKEWGTNHISWIHLNESSDGFLLAVLGP